MKRACLLLTTTAVVLLLVLAISGCNDESKPKITRVNVQPACGVVPLEVEGFTVVSGGNESGSPLGGNNNLEISWTFGDGGTGTTSIAYHTYGAAGDYTVTVTASDPDGNSATATYPVTVLADSLNIAVTTDFPGGVVTTADTVSFFLDASSCAVDYPTVPGDAVKMTYRWKMNDAAATVFRGVAPRFQFVDPGEYDVDVAVTLTEWAVTRFTTVHVTVNP